MITISVILLLGSIVGIALIVPDASQSHDPFLDLGDYWVEAAITATVVIAAVAALLGTITLFTVRNERALKSHQLVRFDLQNETTLVRYERSVQYRSLLRPLVGDETLTESISLPTARFANWLISPVQIVGEDEGLVQFWDSNPELQLDLFGPSPTNPSAVLLGIISLGELSESPAVKRAVLAYLSTKTALGEFETNVDLDSGELLSEGLPPLAPGVRFEGGAIIQEPVDDERLS